MDDYKKFLKTSSFIHHNPHDFLGIREKNVIVQYSPNRKENSIMLFGEKTPMKLIDQLGIFAIGSSKPISFLDYQIIHSDGTLGYDPYEFPQSIPLHEISDLEKNTYTNLYKKLGAHHIFHEGVEGVRFSLFAPNASSVYLCCDLGRWREKVYPMRKISSEKGFFELFIPGCKDSMIYKYLIIGKDNKKYLKSDPYARRYEMRPKTASVVHKEKKFIWTDSKYIKNRKRHMISSPINIYEMHIGAWCREESFPNYKEIAVEIVSYVKEMGYTHVELLPIKEHPLDESWGYQVVGYFSPTSRYGNYEDFKCFVNYLHVNGIGVILDFVPAHFPKDESFLANFDGTALYEHSDPKRRFHPKWSTMIFDFSSKYVQNFLLSSVEFWVENMHVDGIRIDALASILYLNYGKDDHDKIVNKNGGIENLEGFDFIKLLNSYLEEKHPDIIRIAEDESFFGKTTKEISKGGLGFSMKWNIGWAGDLFSYLLLSDKEKCKAIKLFMNSYKEVFNEKYLLILSHDHVSCGNKSLLNKFSSIEEEKFAYLRLLYSVAISHPGKKLFFMGHEVGQEEEFHHNRSWRKKPLTCHRKLKHKCFTKKMNELYIKQKALHEIDFEERGFSWIDYSDPNLPIISFVRKGVKETVLVVHNFSKKSVKKYLVTIPGVKSIEEIMNTDLVKYGGKTEKKSAIYIEPNQRGVYLDLARLSTVICRVVIDDKRYFY